MEVNASPGLEGVETTTGVDVAGKMIAWIERQATPEFCLKIGANRRMQDGHGMRRFFCVSYGVVFPL